MNNIITAQPAKPVIDPEALKKGHAFEDYIVTLFNERNSYYLNGVAIKLLRMEYIL